MIFKKTKKDKAVINRVANKNSVPPAILEDALSHMFSFFKAQMETEDLPKIYIKGFGKFIVKPKTLQNYINRLDYRVEKGYITQEQADKIREVYSKQLERIESEIKQSSKPSNVKIKKDE